jgi:hypothetical protein
MQLEEFCYWIHYSYVYKIRQTNRSSISTIEMKNESPHMHNKKFWEEYLWKYTFPHIKSQYYKNLKP